MLNPVFVIGLPFFAYLCAEMLSLSSIIALEAALRHVFSIVFCGAFMKGFVRENLTEKSFVSIGYFIKVTRPSPGKHKRRKKIV